MCPMCWATALASFALFFVVSVVVVAGTDLSVIMVALILGGSAICHKMDGLIWLPWWWYASVAALLLLRVGYLVFLNRQNLLIVKAWEKAKAHAKGRCPTKPPSKEGSEKNG